MKSFQTPVTSSYTGTRGHSYFEQRAHSRSASSQRRRAEFFSGICSEHDRVLDFGCGTGGLLSNLPARKRIGVEISPDAAAHARTVLDQVHSSIDEVPTAEVDAVISFHAIEHLRNPYDTLCSINRVLVRGGRFQLIVPYEFVSRRRAAAAWQPNDVDLHLYGWTPLTFGNLCTEAGLSLISVTLRPMSISKRFGRVAAPLLSWAKGVSAGRLQITAIGTVK